MTTPILSLAEMEEAQANPHLIFNAAVRALEAALGRGFTSIINSDAADYTLAATDAGAYIRRTRGTAQTLTVPANATTALPVNFTVHVRRAAVGDLIVVPEDSNVTINAASLDFRDLDSVVTLIKVGTDEWDLIGDVAASV
jgi:hypothetical protein